jgi:DNA/RNA endonuclease YhcR with UshA esterase domain
MANNRLRAVKVVTLVLLATIISASQAQAQTSISAVQAKNHVGENATVCGEIASTHFAERSRGTPTFINLDSAYPQPIFTVLIWGSDRTKFGNPEQRYSGKYICVTGTITLYRGVPEIIAHEPSQIRVQ